MSETLLHTQAAHWNARLAARYDGGPKQGHPLTDAERASGHIAQEVFEARERAERAIWSGASDDEIIRCVYAYLIMRAAQEGRVIAA